MRIPICLGMPRSASRMTWQIVKHLSPQEPPPTWYPKLLSEWRSEADNIWPLRGHYYLPDVPVIYTLRNPVEAFLSLQSRFMTEVGKYVPAGTTTHVVAGETITAVNPQIKVEMTENKAAKDAMVGIGQQWEVWKRLRNDAAKGRKCLFLRYEDYYDDRMKKIKDIANWMEVELSESHAQEIFDYTSIENNTERSQNPQFYSHPDTTFSHGYLCKSGMQKNHINLEIKGRPGAWLETNPNFLKSVMTGMFPALEALKEMTEEMGYELTL